ncbi:GDSL-type esterase/lipase family protein [Sphingomonas beigongshangi]|uniref:GDSL-type esterase/lipase family protein n=1 Tax=Sphingomonas beigongshangi TaxID=2782540 RepID=UPI001EEE18F4|nr:GDSL-type esterase/lipase family protein [Sphingomonas beigongshangi]
MAAVARYGMVAMLLGTVAGGVSARQWVPVWASAQMRMTGADADRVAAAGPATIRQIVHLSAGGTRVRVRLSNVAGDRALVVGAARIAAEAKPGQATVGGIVPLTFGGGMGVTIPAGGQAYTDPLPLATHPGQDLAISLFLPDTIASRTGHPGARATTFLAPGDQSAAASLKDAARIGGWWSLSDVEVTNGPTSAILAIGDSITDGKGIVDDSNQRWPDLLAARLAAGRTTPPHAVVNMGIGGNRVLLDGIGPSLVARFDRDVLGTPGVADVILLEGVNDLGTATRDHRIGDAEHAALVRAITGAYGQLAGRAHAHGIRLIGGTITPFAGNDYYHPDAATEADRQAINAFIRTSGAFDGVIDFDAALRDPAHPDRLLPAYDSGDHLHPGPGGYRAMADAVPLALFDTATAAAPPAQPPQIALTFDDMPAHGPLPVGDDRLAIARRIIAALKAAHAPAFGFYNGGFATDATAPQVVGAWRAAGFPIGNHSWTHGDLATVGPDAFLADVWRDEPPLVAASRGSDWHWFRYPFLSEGRNAADRDAVRAGLRARGYRIAAVTMSFGDYGWNDAYARCVAKRDQGAIAGLESSFLAAARVQALRSRMLSQAALGRDIPYVLLMHLGAFDAHMLPRLLDLYRSLGFTFTTLARAEADPFYAAATDLSRPGPSPTLEAAAAAKGVAVPANAPLPDAHICA